MLKKWSLAFAAFLMICCSFVGASLMRCDCEAGPRGPMGPTGYRGDRGPRGMNGNPGRDGPRGPLGNSGDPGPERFVGLLPSEGRPGPQGPPGLPGPPGDRGRCQYCGWNRPRSIQSDEYFRSESLRNQLGLNEDNFLFLPRYDLSLASVGNVPAPFDVRSTTYSRTERPQESPQPSISDYNVWRQRLLLDEEPIVSSAANGNYARQSQVSSPGSESVGSHHAEEAQHDLDRFQRSLEKLRQSYAELKPILSKNQKPVTIILQHS